MTTKRSTFFPGWKVVIGSAIGIPFGSQTVFVSGFALLAAAMANDFGWSQSDVAKGATVFLVGQMVVLPVVGALLDRVGTRLVAASSIVAFAMALFALSRTGNSLAGFLAAVAVLSFVSGGTNPVSYARAISLWFDRKRGLALGLAGGAQSIGLFLIPLLEHIGFVRLGWSVTLLALAGFELLVCLPLVLLLVRNGPEPYGLYPDGIEPALSGERTAAAGECGPGSSPPFPVSTFVKLATSFAFMGLTLYAIMPNIVFILNERTHLSLADIASLQAVIGIATLVGRVAVGHLLDRFAARGVALLALAAMVLAAVILATSTSYPLLLLAVTMIGLGLGGDADLMPYLAGKYFGLRSVSRTFAWFLSAFFLGAAVGPLAFAHLSEEFGGAATPLLLLAILQFVPGALFLSIRPVPDPEDVTPLMVPPMAR